MTYLVQVQNVLFSEVLVELLVFFPYVVELPVFVVALDVLAALDVLVELVFVAEPDAPVELDALVVPDVPVVFVAAQSFDLLVEVELVFQIYQHSVELFHLL